MAPWEILGHAVDPNPERVQGADGARLDCILGWVYRLRDLESGAPRKMGVYVDSSANPEYDDLSEESRRAVETEGRSEVQRFLEAELPPRRMLIGRLTTSVLLKD